MRLNKANLTTDPPQFGIANALFIYLTLHGVLGILRFGHPQLSLNTAFRKVYEISFISLRVLPSTLITAQVYLIYACQLELIRGTATSSLLFTYDLTYFILGGAAIAVLNDLWKSGSSCVKATILIVNVALLIMLGSLDESYWTIFLAVQILWNNLGLDLISNRYEVCIGVYCEVFTIGLSFFNIFAYNSLSESIELIVASYNR